MRNANWRKKLQKIRNANWRKKLENAKCKLEEKIGECKMQIGGKNWRMLNANWRKKLGNAKCKLEET